MKIDARIVALCVACFIGGWWFSGGGDTSPLKERPVLRVIAKAAKTLLWLSVFVEQPPAQEQAKFAHARVDADGMPLLDHSRGW
jgi:hypothetical protein